MVYKTIHLRVFTIDFRDARRLTDKLVGLFANDMAELLSFSIWGGLIVCVLFHKRWQRAAWIVLTLTCIPVFLSLKSRAGFVACAAIALVLGAVKWRRVLLLFPAAILAIVVISPSVVNRVTMGMSEYEDTDWDTVSAGRTTYLWPAALEQIAREPLIGNGRMTIKREPAVYDRILELGGRVPAHPHNSYLEVLMDAGVVGLLVVLTAAGGILVASARLLRGSGDPIVWSAGACGVCAIVAELAAGVAGSSFWPGQSEVPYMVVWGSVFAIAAERRAAESHRHVRHRATTRRVARVRNVVLEGGQS
jgi:O-antigen ligase